MLDGIVGIAEDDNELVPTIGAISVCRYCGTAILIGDGQFEYCSAERWNELEPHYRHIVNEACWDQLGHPVQLRDPGS